MGMEVVVFFFSFLWSTQEKSRDIFLGEEEDAFGDITLLVLAQICKIWALQIVSMAASIITEEFNLRELQKELAAIEVRLWKLRACVSSHACFRTSSASYSSTLA